MGKTSLLRQLEFLTDLPDSHLVPLFWDFQGCSTPQDLSDELYFALEEVQERFETYGVEVEELEGLDAIKMLRKLKKPLRQAGKNLFLLIDEAEVLLEIGNRDPKWLARLRKALQNDNLHTLITSTKLLSQLNHMSDSWNTSPFLLGFNLVNLWSLDLHAASALVCQEQAEHLQITIPQEMLDNILTYTNRHPYLIQYLCQQLFEVDKTGRGYLRAIQDDDLIPDQLVEGFFQIDFGQLTNIERRILLSVASFSMATDDDLLTALSDEHPERIRTFTYGLNKLGHLRNVYDRWTIGNEFLRYWLQHNLENLSHQPKSAVSDTSFEVILEKAKRSEHDYLMGMIQNLQTQLTELTQQQRVVSGYAQAELGQQIILLNEHLANAKRELKIIPEQHG